MVQALKCPNCGAPLDYPADDLSATRCPYCDSTIIIPKENFADSPQVGQPSSSSLPQKQTEALVEIAYQLQAGKKIEAIKIYRDTFGVGLKEAKEAVEAMQRGKPVTIATSQSFSQSFTTSTSMPKAKKGGFPCGCVIVVIVTLLLLTPLVYFFTPLRAYVTIPGDEAISEAMNALPIPKPYASAVQTIGSEGIGPGKFTDARHVAVDGEGNIYVAEWEEGSRVQKFDPEGNYLSQFTLDESKGIVTGLAVDRNGIAYVLQPLQLGRYDGTTGEFLGELTIEDNTFDDMATTVENGVIAIANRNQRDALVHFNSQGKVLNSIPNPITSQTDDAELDPQVAIDGRGNIYILGTFINAVLKYGPDGKYITRFGSEGDNPGQFRAAHDLAVDNQGRVYVTNFGEVDVFSPEGRSIGSFSMPSGPAFGLIFNDKDELFIASRTHVYKFVLNE